MQMQEDIEIQLWAYIDGQCSAEEKQRIEKLLATDPVWKTAYADINTLHHSLQQAETEEPSMRFTQNTMDAIENARIAKRADKYLNSRLIRAMAAAGAFVPAFTRAHFPLRYSEMKRRSAALQSR